MGGNFRVRNNTAGLLTTPGQQLGGQIKPQQGEGTVL